MSSNGLAEQHVLLWSILKVPLTEVMDLDAPLT